MLLHDGFAVVIYGKVNNWLALHSPGVTTIVPEYENK